MDHSGLIYSLLAEFSPTSMVVTSTDFLIIQLFAMNRITQFMEYAVYVFVAFFIVQEIVKVSICIDCVQLLSETI
jgi:hypothetical protein